MSNDPYFGRMEVSNSDLTELEKYWMPEELKYDLEKAFAEGTLVDAMITEPHRIDYFKFRVAGEDYQYSPEQFDMAVKMKRAVQADPFCAQLLRVAAFQKVTVRNDFPISYQGFNFTLDMRCKWDAFVEIFDLSADFKTTAATTQKQAEEAVRHFSYDRSRALYLDLEDRCNDMIIFISKVNFKVFKVPVKRGSEIYKTGREKYEELAFKWWYLFGNEYIE